MKKQLVRNSFTGIIQTVIAVILSFSVIPVFINLLGLREYGVFSTIMVIGNLNTFVNIGLANALVKFLAEQGKCDESDYDIVVTLGLTIIIMLPFTLIAIVFNEFILLKILNLPVENFTGIKFLYAAMLVSNFFLFIGQVFKSVLEARQKIDLNNYLQIFYNLVYWFFILAILLLGYGLGELGLAFFIASITWFLLSLYYSSKYWGRLRLAGISRNYKRIVIKQLSYGMKIFTSSMIAFFYEPFTKILISHFIGVTEVGYYDIALRIRTNIWNLVTKGFAPLYPLLASMKDKDKIRLYIHDIEQKSFLVVLPIAIIVLFVTRPFISLWLGQNIRIISDTTVPIVTAYLIAITVVPLYIYLIASGNAGKTIIMQSANVFFNALFFYITYPYFGYYAVVIGNVAAIASSYTISIYYQKKLLESLVFDNFMQVIKLILIGCLIYLLGVGINFSVSSDIGRIFLHPTVIFFASIVFYRLFRVVSEDDVLRYAGGNERLQRWGMRVFVRR